MDLKVKMMFKGEIFHQEYFDLTSEAYDFYNYVKKNTENKVECN